MPKAYDLCVLGGAGHVGAPLAIALADRGFRVLAYDIDTNALDRLANGTLPFMERGADGALERTLRSGNLDFSDDPSRCEGIPNLIFAIGTPPGESGHPSEALSHCIDTVYPYVAEGACIMLRSTVRPGYTDSLDRDLRSRGKPVSVAYCPERVTQGAAFEEMPAIAQIVGGCTAEAARRSADIFRTISSEIVEMSPIEAEYAKLICNAFRYIQFAATNELSALVESAGVDYNSLLVKAKQGYPRMSEMPRAGFAAGPCLKKDTAQLTGAHGERFALGDLATEINEGMPARIVSELAKTVDLAGKRVGILGMAFKGESDDGRGSLSYGLRDLLANEGAVVSCSDEYLSDPSFLGSPELVANSDIVIIAAPHRAYRDLTIPEGTFVVDTCGVRASAGVPAPE